MHTSAYLGSETAKQKSSPTETRPGTESEKGLCERPQHTARHLARCVLSGPAILLNVQHAITRNQRSEVRGLDDIIHREELWNAQTRCHVERSETSLVYLPAAH